MNFNIIVWVWTLYYILFVYTGGKAQPKKEVLEKPLEENVNRLQAEGEVARSVDDAIAILR